MTKTRAAVLVRAGLSVWLTFAAYGALAQNTPLLTVPPGPLFVEEGETTMITVSLGTPASQNLEISYHVFAYPEITEGLDFGLLLDRVSYLAASTKDYTDVTKGSVTIESGETAADIVIDIEDDEEIDPTRELLAVFFPPPPDNAYRLSPDKGSTAILVIREGICDRNERLAEYLLTIISNVNANVRDCADLRESRVNNLPRPVNIPRLDDPLRAGDFWDFPQLDSLDLSARLSHNLPDGVFAGTDHTNIIDLSSNTFTMLSPGVFSVGAPRQDPPAENLRELYLGNVPLAGLPAGIFGGMTRLKGLHLPTDAAGEPLLPLDVGFVRVGEKESTTVADLKLTIVQGAPYDITADLSVLRATVSAGGNPVSQLSIRRGKTESEVFTLTRTTDEPGVVGATLNPPSDTEDCRRPSAGEDHACYVGVAFSPARPGFRLGAGAPTLRIKLFLEGALE